MLHKRTPLIRERVYASDSWARKQQRVRLKRRPRSPELSVAGTTIRLGSRSKELYGKYDATRLPSSRSAWESGPTPAKVPGSAR